MLMRIDYDYVVELDRNCYQAKFSTIGITKLSSLRLKKVCINPIWATFAFEREKHGENVLYRYIFLL